MQPAIQVRGDEATTVLMGASTDANSTIPGAFGPAIPGGAGMPAVVMFDSMGRTVIAPGLVNAVRFDFRDPRLEASNNERRLVVTISPGGSPRMCDPQVPAGNPRSC